MLRWIAENALTVIVIAAVLVLVGIAVLSVVKGKKSCCRGDCAACGCCCSRRKDVK